MSKNYKNLVSVDESVFEHLEEDLLGGLVVEGLRGVDLPVPIETHAQPVQLLPHLGHVLLRPLVRVHAVLPRRILRRKTESVPPHWVNHLPTHKFKIIFLAFIVTLKHKRLQNTTNI